MSDMRELIERARAAQKIWIQHMISEGWHGCPICKAVPIQREQKICAICAGKRRMQPRKEGPKA